MILFAEVINKSTDAATAGHRRRVEYMLRKILEGNHLMTIQTAALLAAAQQATTDNTSLRALLQSTFNTLTEVKANLAAALSAGDPAAIAQAQADIDTVTSALNTDDAATKAALAANVAPPPTSAGGVTSGGTASGGVTSGSAANPNAPLV